MFNAASDLVQYIKHFHFVIVHDVFQFFILRNHFEFSGKNAKELYDLIEFLLFHHCVERFFRMFIEKGRFYFFDQFLFGFRRIHEVFHLKATERKVITFGSVLKSKQKSYQVRIIQKKSRRSRRCRGGNLKNTKDICKERKYLSIIKLN